MVQYGPSLAVTGRVIPDGEARVTRSGRLIDYGIEKVRFLFPHSHRTNHGIEIDIFYYLYYIIIILYYIILYYIILYYIILYYIMSGVCPPFWRSLPSGLFARIDVVKHNII